MMVVDHIVGLFSISGCAWGVFAFYTSFRIRRFIIKRYEQETELLDTIFFREHVNFIRYLPDMFASVTYITHLLMCTSGWWIYRKNKAFRDIKTPSVVIQYFSKKEIRRVKQFAINGVILILHGIAYVIFRMLWPEAFS